MRSWIFVFFSLAVSCSAPPPTSSTFQDTPGDLVMLGSRTQRSVDFSGAGGVVLDCDGLTKAAVRFGKPGFVDGPHAGLFARYEGLPAGEKFIDIWWDEDNAEMAPERVNLGEGDRDQDLHALEAIFEHTYPDVVHEETKRVRATLRVEGVDGECVRVRDVVVAPASASTPGPAPLSVDLSISGSASSPSIAPFGTFTYDLRVDNAGPSLASGVVVTLNLPGGFTFQATAGCSAAGLVVTCNLADIGAGANQAISINVLAPGSANTSATAIITGTVADSDGSNNSVTIRTVVR